MVNRKNIFRFNFLFAFVLFTLFLIPAKSTSQSQRKLLEKAYEEKSNKLLKQFFQNWNLEIQPPRETEFSKLNDTIRQTYNVFTVFYSPDSLERLGSSEWGNDIYKNADYLIIQESIKIYFSDKVYHTDQEIQEYLLKNRKKNVEDSSKQIISQEDIDKLRFNEFFIYQTERVLEDSITDFRPIINCKNKLPLYMTSKYSKLINRFLGQEHTPLGEDGIMNPARSEGESEARKEFLEKYIKIWYGHWGGYWQLYSYPEAYSITFDKDMTFAMIHFRMVYEGGIAFLKNNNGQWSLISAKLTWIE